MKIIDNTFAAYEAALPPVTHDGQQMIDARSLHGWLGPKWAFTHWLNGRVKDYGFIEGTDFVRKNAETPSTVGRPRKDYLLTLDMAKELAMVERTDKGRIYPRFATNPDRLETQAFLRVSRKWPINPHSWTEKPIPR